MLTLSEVPDRWYSGEPIPGLCFRLNDSVEITAGPHAGEGAAVISVEAVAPEVLYLVELGSGKGDLVLPEAHLRSAA